MAAVDPIEIPAPSGKLVTFHRLIPTARLPQRADRSAAGMLPTRAFRYCEPLQHCVRLWLLRVPGDGFFAPVRWL